MTGWKILEMKMKYRELELAVLRKNDLISLKTVYDELNSEPKRYIFKNHSTKDSSLAAVPIDNDFEEIPGFDKPTFILHIPIESITYIKRLPKTDLLFLLNQIENPHVKNAIESLYEGKRSR